MDTFRASFSLMALFVFLLIFLISSLIHVKRIFIHTIQDVLSDVCACTCQCLYLLTGPRAVLQKTKYCCTGKVLK